MGKFTRLTSNQRFDASTFLQESAVTPVTSLASNVLSCIGGSTLTAPSIMCQKFVLDYQTKRATSDVGSLINTTLPDPKSGQVVVNASSSDEPIANSGSAVENQYTLSSFTKLNSSNTAEDEDYNGLYIGFMEKKDSPVRLIIEDPSGEREEINQFFLTSVSYEMKEKIQMMSMLDNSDMIYFFGDSPTMVSFAGICLDTKNFQWLTKLTNLYKERIRGTMSTALGYKISVCYDDEIVTGVIINMLTTKTSASLNQSEVRFTMVITDKMSMALNQSDLRATEVKSEDFTKDTEGNIISRTISSIGGTINKVAQASLSMLSNNSANKQSSETSSSTNTKTDIVPVTPVSI